MPIIPGLTFPIKFTPTSDLLEFARLSRDRDDDHSVVLLKEGMRTGTFPSINDPFFHSWGAVPISCYYQRPNLLRAAGELGYNFDSPSAIKIIRAEFINFLNMRGLHDNGCIQESTTLASFEVLGEFSHSKAMDDVVQQSKYAQAKAAYNRGRQNASARFREITNEISHVLPVTVLAQLTAEYVMDQPGKLIPN